jgi:LPXTG-motif cell wall-anchored protein
MIKYTQDHKTITPTVAKTWVLSTSPVAVKTATVLPKTGSAVDMNVLVGLGALIMMLGVAMFIADRRKREEEEKQAAGEKPVSK